jgi:hypothetical protein
MNQNGGGADRISLNIRNADTASIPRGSCVVLQAGDGTKDGMDVVLPSSATTGVYGALYGVAMQDIAVGGYGEAAAFGFVPGVIIRRDTRAASTDSWASQASLAAWHVLAQDTVNNCFSTSAASQAASNFRPNALLASSLASYASSASTSTDTRTAITVAAKVFLRLL